MTTPTEEIPESLDDFSKRLFGHEPASSTPEPEEPELEDDSTPEDDTPAEESEVDEEPQETPEPAPKKKKTVQERIDEVTAQRYEIERQATADKAALEAQIKMLTERLDKIAEPPKAAEPPTPVNTAPDPDAVDDAGNPLYPLGQFDPKFQADWVKWNFAELTAQQKAEAAKEAEARAAEEKQRQEYTALQTQWENRVAKVTETLPDFYEKGRQLVGAFTNLDPGYAGYLEATLMSMEHGPEVLYYLADHPDEAKAIVAQGARGATIALGRLEAQFAGVKSARKATEAPPPPKDVLRGSGGRFTVNDDTDDLAAFEKKFYAR